MNKKLIAVMIALMMALLCACASVGTKAVAPSATTETPVVAETPGPAPAPDKSIVILYTNDVHCGVDDNLGYVSLATLKNALLATGADVALMDAGDAVQGAPIGVVSKGENIIGIMNQLGYDLAVPGNHEFDYGMELFLALTKQASFPYLSCNFMDLRTNKPVFDRYQMLTLGGLQIAFVGISTPKTITSSTPAYFQDETGEFIYGFCQDESGQALYDAVQSSVDAARADGAQFVIAVGHCGIAEECKPWMSTDIIANTTGIDAFIDGHSHSVVDAETVKNKDGAGVILTQTGTKLQNIGMLRIDTLGGLHASLVNDAELKTYINDIQSQFEEQMKTVVARIDVDLTIMDPVHTDVRIIRNAETNLGDLCADAYRTIGESDIAIVNGGGIRTSIAAGDITYENIINVHPFGNNLCVVQCTGQQILDALELSAKDVPGEYGGFLQVSGLTYEIHTYIPSSVKLDENKMFVSVDGEYRVKNVKVGDAPLDLTKEYTLASHDYLLKNGGDGYTMFKDCAVVKDQIMVDNQVLITYITDTLGGVVGADYAEPYGQGRIVAVETAPVA